MIIVPKLLILLVLSLRSNALRLGDERHTGPETAGACTITFAPHSGFGNQLLGAFSTGFIAKVAGCKLHMPPILGHGKKGGGLSYGAPSKCLRGLGQEKDILKKASQQYRNSKLLYSEAFDYTSLVTTAPPAGEPTSFHFLPVHCSLWKEQGEDAQRYGNYLKAFIQKTDPHGHYTIGSGYNAGVPRLHIGELFSSLTTPLRDAISNATNRMASLTKKSGYACVHLRSGDDSLSKPVTDATLNKWVSKHLTNIGKPLLIATAETDANVNAVLGLTKENSGENLKAEFGAALKGICSQTQCIRSREVLSEGVSALLKGDRQMIAEMALCSQADEIYLPNAQHKILAGKKINAPAEGGIFLSTFSDVISEMAFWHAAIPEENLNHPWRRPER